MSVEIITKEDLEKFRHQLLDDIKQYIKKPEPIKQWLKSSDVRKLLKISPGTLQNLRIKGLLRFTRIEGTMYYKYEDIERMMRS